MNENDPNKSEKQTLRGKPVTKIIHFREKCIGCNSCVEHAPQFWKMDKDGKSTLVDAVKKKEIFIRNIDDAFVAENKLAEKDCPVKIIKLA